MEEIRKYPVGMQTFSDIREGNYVYVDKTRYIVDFLRNGSKYVFLSRPRRFGKSLFVSTLQAYYEGRKELFDGLALGEYEKEWVKHPVLHFDMSTAKNQTPEGLEEMLGYMLSEYEQVYGRDELAVQPSQRLQSLVKRAYKKTGQKVVVLIDEYDAPLLDVVHEKESLMPLRLVMRKFYSPLKYLDPWLEFTFITGITKFSQLSIFSEINNLDNISMFDQYSAICGISKTELLTQMKPDVEILAKALGKTFDETVEELKNFYDGYHFSKRMTDIFNPFSILNAFDQMDLGSYWFKSGTPTYLVRLLNHFDQNLNELIGKYYATPQFDDYKADVELPLPMIYQSGYLTIKGYDRDTESYLLDIPNNEVREGLLTILANSYLKTKEDSTSWLIDSVHKLKRGDLEAFMEGMTAFLASIPYSVRRKKTEREYERHFQYTFYLLLRMLSCFTVFHEKETSKGRADCVIETPKDVYIFEFKLDDSADAALQQIRDKGYAKEYQADSRTIHLIGANFSSEEGTVNEWKEG